MIHGPNDLAPQLESLLISQPDWLKPGDRVCVAISGGSDSIALADLIIRLSKKWDWSVIGLHFDHELRGSESEKDAEFVREFFDSRQIPLVTGSKSQQLALEPQLDLSAKKGSMEMLARDHRHRFLATQALNFRANRLVLAHHQDDQHELFWIRLLRGASIQGLAGMLPMAPSPVDPSLIMLRPLLSFSKTQILQYLKYRGLKYREDSSNQSLKPLRNRIRRQLLPNLAQSYQPGIRSVTERWISTARETQDFLDDELQKRLRADSAEPFENWPRVLKKLKIANELPNLGKKPQQHLVEWLLDHPNQWMELRPGQRVRLKPNGALQLEDSPAIFGKEASSVEAVDCDPEKNDESYAIDFTKPGKVSSPEFDLEWSFEAADGAENDYKTTLHPNTGLKHGALSVERFDLAKIGSKGWIRRIKSDDRFHPIGATGARSMNKYLSGLGISASSRNRSWVAVNENGEIFWNQFGRISELFRLDKSTSQRLLWRFTRVFKTLNEQQTHSESTD